MYGVKEYNITEIKTKLERFIDLLYQLNEYDNRCFRSVRIINNPEFGKEGGHDIYDFQVVRYRKSRTKILIQGDSISAIDNFTDKYFPFSELDSRIKSLENRIDYMKSKDKNG